MKNLYLLATLVMVLCSCSSNDEENLPVDELLAGTEWRYGTFYDDDDDYLDVPPSTSVDEDTYYDTFFDRYFPDV